MKEFLTIVFRVIWHYFPTRDFPAMYLLIIQFEAEFYELFKHIFCSSAAGAGFVFLYDYVFSFSI